ncbi:MAG: phosphate ABC transporter substrate-binding protein [Moraxellaceae bacterium]|nr:MAG: phosphate ABC transporter substrate-binding protein [Moraxellaceae bacterium]
MKILPILAISGALLTLSFHSVAGIVVIGNAALPDSTLNKKMVKKIFLGKAQTTPEGADIIPVDQAESAVKDEFYNKATKKTPAKLQQYWMKRVMSGKGTKLDVKGDDAAVKAWVGSNAGAIGYVDDSVVDGSVKVLFAVP